MVFLQSMQNIWPATLIILSWDNRFFNLFLKIIWSDVLSSFLHISLVQVDRLVKVGSKHSRDVMINFRFQSDVMMKFLCKCCSSWSAPIKVKGVLFDEARILNNGRSCPRLCLSPYSRWRLSMSFSFMCHHVFGFSL